MRSLIFTTIGAFLGSLMFGWLEPRFLQVFVDHGYTLADGEFYYSIFLGICIFLMFALVMTYDRKA